MAARALAKVVPSLWSSSVVSEPSVSESADSPIVLERRLGQVSSCSDSTLSPSSEPLRLPLSADQRSSLRGHRRSACGRDLLLQLPRGAALEPGEHLAGATGSALVIVEAAPEPLLRVRSPEPLALLQAAYHLGNRHVAMELQTDQLRLLQDSVLEELLRQRGLDVERITAPFEPESGAYASAASHSHSHGH